MRVGLILKSIQEIGIEKGRNVLAFKAHVNNLIIMCAQWYFIFNIVQVWDHYDTWVKITI